MQIFRYTSAYFLLILSLRKSFAAEFKVAEWALESKVLFEYIKDAPLKK